MNALPIPVRNASKRRFEAATRGSTAWLEYICAEPSFVIAHTEVPAALQGQGLGAGLIRAAMRYATTQDLTVVVVCPFAAAYLRRHPEFDGRWVGS
jgi:predicted GNAT family acetyltransferase